MKESPKLSSMASVKPKLETKAKVTEGKDYKESKLFNVLKKRDFNQRLAEQFHESCEIKD